MVNNNQRGQKRGSRAVFLWLAEEDIARLKTIAHDKGIGHTTLIRMWVKEKLNQLKATEPEGR